MEGKVPLTAFATVTDRTQEEKGRVDQEGAASSVSFPGFPTQTKGSSSSKGEPRPIGAAAPAPTRRKKVPFEKGYSQVDWVRLTRSPTEDLNGNRGRPLARKITLKEVGEHKTVDDCWMVLAGKVYNVTRYIKFHPGGVDYLMQGAGKDATRLFNKYHKWVNIDFLLAKCYLGQVDKTPASITE